MGKKMAITTKPEGGISNLSILLLSVLDIVLPVGTDTLTQKRTQ